MSRILASGCQDCEPQLLPSLTLAGNGHVAVHLDPVDPPFAWQHQILIDGELVTDVAEAWPGQPGRVKRYHPTRNSPHYCLCGSTLIFSQLLEYDSVEVVSP